MKLRLTYNAPVTLTFALISTIIVFMDSVFKTNLVGSFFSAPGRGLFDFGNVSHYFRLFTHILGHAGWAHLLGNFSFILLLGPRLEEKHGSFPLLFMILITAFITGLLNALLVPNSRLAGASGIAFMMILLSSFTKAKAGEIPLSFILVALLFLSKEIYAAFQENVVTGQKNNISELAHIAGGLCGALFGFLLKDREGEGKEEPPIDIPES